MEIVAIMTPDDDGADQAYIDLIWQVFRLNVQLNLHGNEIAAQENLTVTRWQLLGALAANPCTVAQLAREWGYSRQSIQRTVNWLIEADLVELVTNPKHKRSKILQLTEVGRATRERLLPLQRDWMNRVRRNLDVEDLRQAKDTLEKMRVMLQDDLILRRS